MNTEPGRTRADRRSEKLSRRILSTFCRHEKQSRGVPPRAERRSEELSQINYRPSRPSVDSGRHAPALFLLRVILLTRFFSSCTLCVDVLERPLKVIIRPNPLHAASFRPPGCALGHGPS